MSYDDLGPLTLAFNHTQALHMLPKQDQHEKPMCVCVVGGRWLTLEVQPLLVGCTLVSVTRELTDSRGRHVAEGEEGQRPRGWWLEPVPEEGPGRSETCLLAATCCVFGDGSA